ncbi:MAG TPA: AAA domain-containing protein [Kofleriaceae bacterium]|nr:AAA domain-containing protein [Kofleriaceae bacterium]
MSDARDWLDALDRAWRDERTAVRARVAAERAGRSLAERVALGLALDRLRIVDEHSAPGERVRVRVSVPEAIDLDNLRMTPGDPIRLWAEQPDEPGSVRGVYERRDDQSLWLMLDRSVDEQDRDYALDPEAPEVTFDRGEQAIARARAAVATSDLARIREVAARARPPRPVAAVTWTALDDALDDRQRAAVDAALRSGDIALIHGPPGTGKTRTLVEVVRQRARRGERVLCVAPSNTAVDNLGLGLGLGLGSAPAPAEAGLRAVRLGHPARVHPALLQLTLDAQVDADGATRLAREWRDRARAVRKTASGKRGAEAKALWQEARALDRDAAREIANAERAILERADVVLATCVGCDHPLLGRGDEATVFDCVVVDEATQAPDPLLLIALGRGKVCVLAGDPQQLGPVVTGGPVAEATLGSTLFERLARAASSAHGGPPAPGPGAAAAPGPSAEAAVMLEQQHRMHAEIMRFPSRTMYDDRLRAAPAVAGHTLDDLGALPDPLRPRPLWLIDTAGKDWVEQRGSGSMSPGPDFEPGTSLNMPVIRLDPSTFNAGNAERVAAEVRRLLSRGLPPTEIAVIAAYSAQARRLRELLRAERAAGLEIGTVDGFQGREKEAVIVDLVRSNELGELGFLTDTRRMNVALTRARRFLLVIADSATLGAHPYYAAFLSYVDEIDAHGSAWSDDAPPL